MTLLLKNIHYYYYKMYNVYDMDMIYQNKQFLYMHV